MNRQIMMQSMAIIILAAILCFPPLLAAQIPQDVEILEGYEFDESPEYYNTDGNSEARSLLSGFNKAIRDKRSVFDMNKKRSPGIDAENRSQNPLLSTTRLENRGRLEVRENNETSEENISEETPLPKAEKQIMDPDHDYYSAQRRMSHWNNDYPGPPVEADVARIVEDDPIVDATNNYIMRDRQARVNFITQPKGVSEPLRQLPEPLVAKVPSAAYKAGYDDYYRYPSKSAGYNYDSYPSRSYDPYLRRYDRYDEQQYSRYDPYYDERMMYRRRYDPYDSYSPRMPKYPDQYYDYPDRRYDTPEPRDPYPPSYYNDVYDQSYQGRSYYNSPYDSYKGGYKDYSRSNNNRIIYYAHLPEVTRSPYDYYRYDRDPYDRDRYDRDRYAGQYRPTSSAYKLDKSLSNPPNGPVGPDNGDRYDYVKRDKKDNVTPQPQNSNNNVRP